jgi:ATP-dependent Lon protease
LPVSKDQARSIIALVQENAERGSATGNVLGTAPLLSEDNDKIPKLSQWGCSGRIIRLTRPSPLQPSQPFTLVLHGLTRFTFVGEPALTTKDLSGPLKRLSISYPPLDSDAPPKAETVQTFKAVALKLLDRLAQEAANASQNLGGSTKRSAWLKLSDMVQEVTDDRAASFADVMIGAINGEYIDKLGTLAFTIL